MTNDHQTTQGHLDSQELLYVLVQRQITELRGQDSLSGGPLTGAWKHISTMLVILTALISVH